MQIKSTVGYTLLQSGSERPSLTNQQTTSVGEDVEKGNPGVFLVGMQTIIATVENSMEFPQKSKVELPFDPGSAQFGYTLRILKHQFRRTYAFLCS